MLGSPLAPPALYTLVQDSVRGHLLLEMFAGDTGVQVLLVTLCLAAD